MPCARPWRQGTSSSRQHGSVIERSHCQAMPLPTTQIGVAVNVPHDRIRSQIVVLAHTRSGSPARPHERTAVAGFAHRVGEACVVGILGIEEKACRVEQALSLLRLLPERVAAVPPGMGHRVDGRGFEALTLLKGGAAPRAFESSGGAVAGLEPIGKPAAQHASVRRTRFHRALRRSAEDVVLVLALHEDQGRVIGVTEARIRISPCAPNAPSATASPPSTAATRRNITCWDMTKLPP